MNELRLRILIGCLLFVGSCTSDPTSLSTDSTGPAGETVQEEATLLPVRINGRWGYADTEGKIVIAPRFGFARTFSEGLAPVNEGGAPIDFEPYSSFLKFLKLTAVTGGKWGFINKKGQWAIPPAFDDARCFRNGLATVNVGGKHGRYSPFVLGGQWGAIDKSGNTILETKFSFPLMFREGLAPSNEGGKQNAWGLVVGGKWGFVDTKGKIVIRPRFEMTLGFSEGLAAVNVGGHYEEKRSPSMDVPFHSFEGGKWGFIDSRGEFVIAPEMDKARPFSEGLAAVKVEDQWGYVDPSGQFVIAPEFEKAGFFSEGLANAHVLDGRATRTGFIDRTGKMVIVLDEGLFPLRPFSQGLAMVVRPVRKGEEMEGECGFVDKSGKIVIPLKFPFVAPFAKGVSCVRVGDRMGYIDKTGKYVWEPTK